MRDSEHILVVEDDPVAREGLAELLQLEGYEVETATDGADALRLIRSDRFDLVLSDLKMPRMGGFQLLEHLRHEVLTRDLPVILISALSDPPLRVHGLDLGADDYVTKPVEPEELLARIRARLRRASESQRLRRFAVVDELTGVLNRRGIREELEIEWKRTIRTGSSLSVLMVDIDRFKEVNDRYGHLAGDVVLRQVGRALAERVRAHDRVGRVGGDEFLVILPETAGPEAGLLADRLRDPAGDHFLLPGDAAVRIRLSIGAATREPAETLEALIERADQEMYRDKRAGASVAVPRRSVHR